MARGKGTANLAASLEVLAGAPLDARDVCPTVEDLYAASNWPYKYIGMKTTVLATGDTYRLVDLDVTQESSWVKEGSGGGGHTIEGDDIAVTDRDTLNFKDMSVSDDSQNEKTDVKPHRLTAEELADIISPLPVHDFSNTSSEAFVCSTNERAIGQWIDGKPLYQKTIDCGALPNSATKEVAHGISNLGRLVYANGNARRSSDGENIPLPMVYANSNLISQVKVSVDSTNVKLKSDGDMSAYVESYVTLRYTKTTDTAVASGEKIIGQWIDGKPLYQKSYVFSKSQVSSGEFNVSHDVDNVDKIWFDVSSTFLTSGNGSVTWAMSAWNASTPILYCFFGVWCKNTKTNGIDMYLGSGLYNAMTDSDSVYVTVRYTKA